MKGGEMEEIMQSGCGGRGNIIIIVYTTGERNEVCERGNIINARSSTAMHRSSQEKTILKELTDEGVSVGVVFSFEHLPFSVEDCVVIGNCYWEVLVPGCSVIVLSVVVVRRSTLLMKCARRKMSREDCYCWIAMFPPRPRNEPTRCQSPFGMEKFFCVCDSYTNRIKMEHFVA